MSASMILSHRYQRPEHLVYAVIENVDDWLVADDAVGCEPFLQKLDFGLIDMVICHQPPGDADQFVYLPARDSVTADTVVKFIAFARSHGSPRSGTNQL